MSKAASYMILDLVEWTIVTFIRGEMIFHNLIRSHYNAKGTHECLASMLQFISCLFLTFSSSILLSSQLE